MAPRQKRSSARARNKKKKSPSPQPEDSSIEEGWSFLDFEDDDVSLKSDATVTPYNASMTLANDTADDSGVGSEVSTPGLGHQLAELGLGGDNTPPLEIVEPLDGHKRILAVVLPHSNGSSGAGHKHQLLDAMICSSGKTLQQEFPDLRWIFPNEPFMDHVKLDKTVEKRRVWVDFGLYDKEAEGTVKMYGSLRDTMKAVKKVIESEGRNLGIEKEIKYQV